MNPIPATAADLLPADQLAQWELRVAQRADELAKKSPPGRNHDLASWLEAEREALAFFPGLAGDVGCA